MNKLKIGMTIALTSVSFLTIVSFQNCNRVTFSFLDPAQNNGTVSTPEATGVAGTPDVPGVPNVCEGVSCDLTPITTKTAVTTILLALGDQVDNQLVIKGVSAQLIAESVVRYTSPKSEPKILFVHDPDSTNESDKDAEYVANELLARYDVTYLVPDESGLTDDDLKGFDLVWFNNPGYPMGSQATRDALLKFAGGVVLEGDDLSRGNNFDLTDLTGLNYVDNGTAIQCGGGKTYDTDNNSGAQFNVSLNSDLFTGASHLNADFVYGNDIDLTTPARDDLEVLAYAKGSPDDCTEKRPAVVRYIK